MIEVRLRPATLADVRRMVDIEIAAAKLFPTEVLPEAVGRTGSQEEIREGIASGLAWVAEAEQSLVVGFLVAKTIGTSMHIVEMDVLPSHGRQGIGGQLLEQAIAQCKVMGLREATLTTFLGVPWNAPFYTQHGFKVASGVSHFPHLDQALQREAARGLKERVAMYRNAAQPGAQADLQRSLGCMLRRMIDYPALSFFCEHHAEEFAQAARQSKALHRPWVHPPTDTATAAELARKRQGPADFGFLVRDCDSMRIAGYVEITNIVRGPFQSGYLGYYVFKDFERRGFMTWALRSVIRHAWKELRLHRLEANIQPENTASIALVRTVGFQREGYSPRYLKVAGRWRDHERWAILVA